MGLQRTVPLWAVRCRTLRVVGVDSLMVNASNFDHNPEAFTQEKAKETEALIRRAEERLAAAKAEEESRQAVLKAQAEKKA